MGQHEVVAANGVVTPSRFEIINNQIFYQGIVAGPLTGDLWPSLRDEFEADLLSLNFKSEAVQNERITELEQTITALIEAGKRKDKALLDLTVRIENIGRDSASILAMVKDAVEA